MKHSIYNKILIGYIIFAALSLISINTFISSKVMDTKPGGRPRSFTTRQMPQVHITAIIIIMYMTLSSTTMKGM